jgi:NADPH:quinone reductase-like Zn-dependent oxidoreductase
MPKAVRYDEFGGIDVLRVDEVERPVPGAGQVLVRVKVAGINISEAVIRTGAVAELSPSTFPSGQGGDLAGVVEEVGAGVGGFSPGDEVIGFSNKRASQAELVLVEAGDLTRKPEKVSWEVAGGLFVAGVTAWGAVHAVQLKEGETVVISGAAGGVGSFAVQLARRAGATVIGLASESNHEWLKNHGVVRSPTVTALRTESGPPRPAAWTPSSRRMAAGTSNWPSPSASRPSASTPSRITRPPRSTG